jgi:hypothetical protein
MGVETFVSKVLNANDLDNQQDMFKLKMKSSVAAFMAPPFDINHLTKMYVYDSI